MTVPQPRQEAGPDWPTVLLTSVRRLEDAMSHGFEQLQHGMTQLRDETVHRREFDRYRDERALEWAEARRQHDADIAGLKTDAEKRAAQATSLRRWLIATGATTCIGIAGVITTIVTHFH